MEAPTMERAAKIAESIRNCADPEMAKLLAYPLLLSVYHDGWHMGFQVADDMLSSVYNMRARHV